MTDADGAPDRVEWGVADGADHGAPVELPVASGGATEVQEMAASFTGADGAHAAQPGAELAWPGPLEAEVPPLFAS
jgi:hypothetical protein